jgi:hypothetical protein
MWSLRLIILGKKSGAWYLCNSSHFEDRQMPFKEMEEAPFPISKLESNHIQNLTLLETHRYDLLQPFFEFL